MVLQVNIRSQFNPHITCITRRKLIRVVFVYIYPNWSKSTIWLNLTDAKWGVKTEDRRGSARWMLSQGSEGALTLSYQ
jgi:hypothetical protein